MLFPLKKCLLYLQNTQVGGSTLKGRGHVKIGYIFAPEGYIVPHTMGSQRFCLRWNNHQSNLLSVFDQLLHDEAFVDVTLAVEGQFLRAHKMVLSACSPYFQVSF